MVIVMVLMMCSIIKNINTAYHTKYEGCVFRPAKCKIISDMLTAVRKCISTLLS